MFKVLLILLILTVGLFSAKLENKLVVVTSFPKDLTKSFKKAFEKKYPNVKVEMLNKKTTAGIKYIQETKGNNKSDIYWVSAPDAFEVLKEDNLLQVYISKNKDIPEKIGSYPLNDPDGYYSGVAAAGYGIMYNTRYLKAKKIPAPSQWKDLAKPIYHGHVGMSAPSRSGTTHLTVEAMLQNDEGWTKGWSDIKRIAGNFKTVTERSFGVPDGVNTGSFGVGIVIDFFGLSSKASGFPVDFIYPRYTAVVPANVGIIANAPHINVAKKFIDFLRSTDGQKILLEPKISRLPINPKTYAYAPKNFPNPFVDKSIGKDINFNVNLSKNRYNLVNSLFDVMITYRLEDLRDATKAVQTAEALLAKKPNNTKAKNYIAKARSLIDFTPVDIKLSSDKNFNAIFKNKRKKKTDKIYGRQAEVEEKWDSQIKANYEKAKKSANLAIKLLK
jgi:ABC-type Fe3+ transport system substrate-binding protein